MEDTWSDDEVVAVASDLQEVDSDGAKQSYLSVNDRTFLGSGTQWLRHGIPSGQNQFVCIALILTLFTVQSVCGCNAPSMSLFVRYIWNFYVPCAAFMPVAS